ncbi:MAG: hypothetical protein WC350_03200 [Candidatus Micrarchaeia archaeon]|jgi:hypothetical protein
MPAPVAQPERELRRGETSEVTVAQLQTEYRNQGFTILRAGEELSGGLNRNLWAAYNPETGDTYMFRRNKEVSFGTSQDVLEAVKDYVDSENSRRAMAGIGEEIDRRAVTGTMESIGSDIAASRRAREQRPATAATETQVQAGARTAAGEELPAEQGRKIDELREQMRAGTFLEPVSGRSTRAPAETTQTSAAPETISAEQARKIDEALNLGSILSTGPAMGVGTETQRRREEPRTEEAAPREETRAPATPVRPTAPEGPRQIVAGRPVVRPREEAPAEAAETAHAGAGYERIGVSFDYSVEGLNSEESRRLKAQVDAACSARDPYALATFISSHPDLEITNIRFSGIDRTQYSADGGATLASELLRYRRESA